MSNPREQKTIDLHEIENREWRESLDYVLQEQGADRVRELLRQLQVRAQEQGVNIPFTANTPYINSIPTSQEPVFPGNQQIERRIKSIIRWNAMAMVVRANRESEGIGATFPPLPRLQRCGRSVSITSGAVVPMIFSAIWFTFKVMPLQAYTPGHSRRSSDGAGS